LTHIIIPDNIEIT